MSKRNAPNRPISPKNTAKTTPETRQSDDLEGWRALLWLLFFANSLVIWHGCLDESLAPRFFFTAAALLGGLLFLKKDLLKNGDLRLHGFDLLFLVWLGINWASVAWAFNWSEAVFYTQKVFLSFLVYWLFRQALQRDENMVRRTLAMATPVLTLVVCGVLLIQLARAIGEVGLQNDALYDYMKGLYGNKGLTANFLFILLIFNALLHREFRWRWMFWLGGVLLFSLILLLQTRTVYISVVAAGLFYFIGRAVVESGFRPFFLKKLLPIGVLGIVILASLLAWKGSGTSLGERLNPATYFKSASANERRFVWYKTDVLNRDHPILGVGNGSWKIFFPTKNIEGAYRLQEKGIIFTRAHNDYLEIRAEMGWVGAIFFVGLFLVAGFSIFWGLKNLEDEKTRPNGSAGRERHDLLVLGAGMIGYCIIQFFDFPRERMEQQVMLAIFFGWTAFLTRDFWKKLPGIGAQKIFPVAWLAAIFGLIFSLAIGWGRISGEIHNYKVLEAQMNNDNSRMAAEALAAENPFYQLSDVVLPMAWYAGIGYFQKGENAKAIEQFARAYQQNPFSFQVINNYAAALSKAGNYREAISFFEKTLEINPRYDEGKFNLSYTYFQLGDYQKALEFAEKVDTIVGAKTPDELEKNAILKKRKAEFIQKAAAKLQK